MTLNVRITNDSGAAGAMGSTLLARLKAGEPEAWRKLVKVNGPLVYQWARRAGLTAEEADDVVQDVFTSVAQHIATFHHDRPGDSFHAWLATITRHKIVDLLRRRGEAVGKGGTAAQQLLLEIPEDSLPTTSPPDREASWRHYLNSLRAEIEPRTWQAFSRVTVDGQPPADVADELGMSVWAVYKAKARVLRRVREEFSDWDGLQEQ